VIVDVSDLFNIVMVGGSDHLGDLFGVQAGMIDSLSYVFARAFSSCEDYGTQGASPHSQHKEV
jgi:hypothetical protein